MSEFDALAESQLNDSHYLKSVTQLGDTRPIIANQEIHAASGLKLVAAGMRIDSSLYERLLQHRLVPPLDQCLSTEDTVTPASLAGKAEQMMRADKRLGKLQSVRSEGQTLPQILAQIPLNPAIAFKLTVMRESHPDLFRHSLYVALVSVYIGMQLELNRNQLVDLATAAVLHDLGIMHVDPSLLERGHRMTETERRHLYAHSVTGWMILRSYPEYKQKVQDAVLQHHERLDGSGYPRSLRSGEIGQFGQIIAVAEIIASRYANESVDHGWSRLETILKLNLRRYGGQLVGYLKVFYEDEGDIPPCSDLDKQAAREKLVRISTIFAAWEKARQECDGRDQICAFIDERMMSLRMEIVDAGLNLNTGDASLLGIEEDARACFDARVLLDETLWQLRNVLREAHRRWPGIDQGNPAGRNAGMQSWMKEAETLL